mmetsp:Transcript_14355/g.31422  ORF Transcript_14355/g.31422 Transcript_14355/m.31422 type:complete len:224 (+) Transcript_14355:366-1037(+)
MFIVLPTILWVVFIFHLYGRTWYRSFREFVCPTRVIFSRNDEFGNDERLRTGSQIPEAGAFSIRKIYMVETKKLTSSDLNNLMKNGYLGCMCRNDIVDGRASKLENRTNLVTDEKDSKGNSNESGSFNQSSLSNVECDDARGVTNPPLNVNATEIDLEVSSSCPICLCEFEVGEVVAYNSSGCSHIYHEECIVRWLPQSNQCPLCKQPFAQSSQKKSRSSREK